MSDTPNDKLPTHIAFIMDGNGRWAKERGLSRAKGHRAGAETVGMCVDACAELGIPWLTFYAFSSENWNRPQDEVKALMELLHDFLKKKSAEMIKKNVRLHAIGDLSRLPDKTQKLLRDTIAKTAGNEKMNIVLALSYGSRMELANAARNIARDAVEGKLNPDEIDETLFSRYLYTVGMPDPDLLVRTSGEFRISNFLLWQISYTEIYVTPKYWPDFSKTDLMEAITDFGNRQRRFGKI